MSIAACLPEKDAMPSAEISFASFQRYTKALPVALGYRDQLTRLHSDRVVDLAVEIGEHYGLAAGDLTILQISAAFHDIGKIGTPDHILLKATAFDDNEWLTMKEHAVIGEQIIIATELEGSDAAAHIVRHHHERWSGRGYPDGLAGEEIPLCSRIISIADSYDAMAVTRSYHRARSHRQIMDILDQETGDKHDPQLMELFSAMIERSPNKAEA
jgi:HD-GYP domain-containing protein (c-di-GMP phosphodiesterase class II)